MVISFSNPIATDFYCPCLLATRTVIRRNEGVLLGMIDPGKSAPKSLTRFAFRFLVFFLPIVGASCVAVEGPIYRIRTDPLPPVQTPGAIYQGEHCGWNLVLVQLSIPSLPRAIEDALKSVPGDADTLRIQRLVIIYGQRKYLHFWQLFGPFGDCIKVRISLSPDPLPPVGNSAPQRSGARKVK